MSSKEREDASSQKDCRQNEEEEDIKADEEKVSIDVEAEDGKKDPKNVAVGKAISHLGAEAAEISENDGNTTHIEAEGETFSWRDVEAVGVKNNLEDAKDHEVDEGITHVEAEGENLSWRHVEVDKAKTNLKDSRVSEAGKSNTHREADVENFSWSDIEANKVETTNLKDAQVSEASEGNTHLPDSASKSRVERAKTSGVAPYVSSTNHATANIAATHGQSIPINQISNAPFQASTHRLLTSAPNIGGVSVYGTTTSGGIPGNSASHYTAPYAISRQTNATPRHPLGNPYWNSQTQYAFNRSQNTDGKYPQDNYSFIALNGPKRNGSWSKERFLFFLFGFVPFVFQMLFLVLLIRSETDELNGTIGENDNPDSEKSGFMGSIASFIPANANQIIRWTQVTAIAAYVIFPSSSLKDIIEAVRIFPDCSNLVQSGVPVNWMRFTCSIKLIQGVLATFSTLLLVVNTNTVVDIILNFTAVNFISNLDDHAFYLAKAGDFGPALQQEAERIANTDLPPCMYGNKKPKYFYNLIVSKLMALVLFGMITLVIVGQNSNNIWVTTTLRVQFAEETGLNEYSGCFGINKTSSSVYFSRRTYNRYGGGDFSSSFGYCREDRRWIFFASRLSEGNGFDPCDASKDESKTELARSSKTDSFDISTSFDEPWVSTSGTPLDLYFFDGGQDEDNLHCESVLGDGICDPSLNTLGYQYDGGDCCSATCTKSKCGRAVQTRAFGDNSSVPEVSFPYCENPLMVPITINFNEIKSSRHPDIVKYNDDWDSYFGFDENTWREEEPESPYFSLVCNGKAVLTLYVKERMSKHSETTMVEDGAMCSLVIRNATSTSNSTRTNNPIWLVDYDIFHDENEIKMVSGNSIERDTVEFRRIPECYFTKLGNYTDVTSMYESIGEANGALSWLVDVDTDSSLCESEDMFIERYALTRIFFALDGAQEFVKAENQCTWSQIKCKQGKVYSIEIQDTNTQGNIPSDIHILAGLEELILKDNNISLFPKEIQNIKSPLLALDLAMNLLTSIPSQIGQQTSLKSLGLSDNALASIPAQIGELTNLQELSVSQNALAFIPSQIGQLTNLDELNFGNNSLTSIPSQIGQLTGLKILILQENALNSIPSQIGQLTNLYELSLSNNFLTSIPSYIGQLTSLQRITLHENMIASIPSYIRQLTSLHTITLSTNMIASIPSYIGQLTSLTRITLSTNMIASIPSQVGQLIGLEKLDLWENALISIPTEIGLLSNLLDFSPSNNFLTSIPSQIGQLTSLTTISLWGNALTSIPTQIGHLTSLEKLYLDDNALTSFPSQIGQLTNLEELGFAQNSLASIPAQIGKLTSLKSFALWNNLLTSIPTEIGLLTNIPELFLMNNSLISIPPQIGKLTRLKTIALWDNVLTSVPSQIGKLTNLQELFFSQNALTSIPSQIGKLTSLKAFTLWNNALTSVPSQIGELTKLQELSLAQNALTSIPSQIGQLTNLQELSLFNNVLTSIPSQIGQLTNLQELFFSQNALTSIPSQIGQLTSLTYLSLSQNALTSIPSQIGQLTSLTYLSLSQNALTSIPSQIGQLTNLQELSLFNNALTSIPSQIGQLTNLQELFFSQNALTSIPSQIGQLTSLTYLSLWGNALNSVPTEIGLLTNLQKFYISSNNITNLPEEVQMLCESIGKGRDC